MSSLDFLLDEDMPKSTAEIIESCGHSVKDVRNIGLRGASDKDIIDRAKSDKMIIITRDTDFGDVLRYPKHPGALILRLPYTYTADEINERLERFLNRIEASKLDNAITILEVDRYRRRKI